MRNLQNRLLTGGFFGGAGVGFTVLWSDSTRLMEGCLWRSRSVKGSWHGNGIIVMKDIRIKTLVYGQMTKLVWESALPPILNVNEQAKQLPPYHFLRTSSVRRLPHLLDAFRRLLARPEILLPKRTSIQAVYVPADDLTDPAPATTFRFY